MSTFVHFSRDPASQAVSAVLVSFNSRAVLRPCLAALKKAAAGPIPLEAILVDNASSDGTADWVRREHPEVKLLQNSSNRGFGAACNQALRVASGRYVLFLNPDTELPADALSPLLEALEADPRAALLSPRLVGGGPPAWGRDPTLARLVLGRLGLQAPREPLAGPVDWVLGACMLGRADVVRALGGFDEDYFLYGEDLDLCDRARAAGYNVLFCPHVAVPHRGNDLWDAERLARVRGALLTFYRKRRSRAAAWLLELGVRAVEVLGPGRGSSESADFLSRR